jgi:radical SAM superfamily enzyme YgiQ (UPF0313 family)
MKVLLIQPPIEDYYTTPIRNYPLGLLFIASKLYDICDVEIIDLRQCKKPIPIKPAFPELEVYYTQNYSPFATFHRYYRFGKRREEIKKIIIEKKPDIVGISCLFSTYFNEALEVAYIVKSIKSDTKIIVGGNHPTLFPEEVLKHFCIDFVIRGDGEEPFRLLVENLMKKKPVSNIPGVCYKQDGDIVISEIFSNTTNELNLKRELIPKENYPYGKGFVAPVLTSKGCCYSCYFCGKPKTKFNLYNINNVKKDIEKLIQAGFDTIDFEDDYLDLTSKNITELLSWLKTKKINITAMNGIVPKIHTITQRLLKESGFQRINISLVDANESIQKDINRAQFKDFNIILDKFIETNIPIETHFIIGLPQQNLEHIIKTIIYLSEKKVLLGPSIFYLSPGSRAFYDYLTNYKNFDFKYARSSAIFPVNNTYGRKEIITLIKLTRFINFVKKHIDFIGKDTNIFELTDSLKDSVDKTIMTTLLKEGTLISYNKAKKKYEKDNFSEKVVKDFLKSLKFVMGYKTKHICEY